MMHTDFSMQLRLARRGLQLILVLAIGLPPLVIAQTSQDESAALAAIAAAERSHGQQSPELVKALEALLLGLVKQGRYDEAIAVGERILRIETAVYGQDHVEVADTLSGLAWMHQSVNRGALAMPLYERSLAIRERALGLEHVDVASSLNNMAELQYTSGQYALALPLYQRSLAIREKALGPDHVDVARSLNNLAILYDTTGQYALALPLFQRSLAIREKALGPDHIDVATGLNNLAELYHTTGKFAQALPLYQRSLAIYEKALGPDHVDVAASLGNLARLYQKTGNHSQAMSLYQHSLAIVERALGPYHVDVARDLNNLASLYEATGQYVEALALFKRSLSIREAGLGPDHVVVASSLNNLALLYKKAGQYAEALPLYQRSLTIYEGALGPDHLDVARSLNNLAALYGTTGHYAQALPLHWRSLAVYERALGPDHLDVARSLNNLAILYDTTGQYALALPLYQRSLSIREKALGPEHADVALSLNNLAGLYQSMGQHAIALPLYQRSLAINEGTLGPDHVDVASVLANLAELYRATAEYEQALTLHQRSLAVREKALGPNHVDVATSLNNLAMLYRTVGAYEQAMPLFQRSLSIREETLGPDHIAVARGLNNLATLYETTGQYAQALPLYQRALEVASAAGGADLLWLVQGNLAGFYQAQGGHEVAIYWGKQSVNNLQSLRGSLTSLDKELQGSFVKERSWAYTNLADLLIAEGRIPEAQQVLQMLKERELYDEVLRGEVPASGRQVDLTGLERAKFSDYYRIRDQLVTLATERRQLQAKKEGERSAADQRRLNEITEKLFPQVNRAMNTFMVDLQRDFSKSAAARGEDIRVSLEATQDGLRSTIEDLASPRGEPAARAVGLQYVVSDKRLSIILTVPGGPPIARQLDLDRAELNRRINQITLDLKSSGTAMDGDKGILRQAQELYRILIEPVLPDLKKADARTLMVSATDVLRFLPFAVLHDGKSYLVQDYALAVYNEAATKMPKPTKKDWRIAGFGLSEAVPGLRALDAVPAELTSVLSHSPNGQSLLNKPFTRGRLRDALNGEFDAVHLASHFVVQLGDTNDSRLYLGDKSALSLEQFAGTDIRFDGIELVTLSACDTAVGGGRTSNGQEMESLSAKVQRQGAAAVLATLWQVADRSTGKLMARFYENKLAGSMNKAQALRTAQLALLSGQERLNKQQDWKHPFYWAPFVLMGNWR